MTAETTASPMALETNQRPWWLTLIGGCAAMVIGGVLLWGSLGQQATMWITLVTILGLYWIITGILDLVHMFTDHSGWGWKLFMGIISIVAGSYIVMYPLASSMALPRIMVFVLGFWALVQGIIMLVMAFKGAGLGAAILGGLGIILGLVLMGNYQESGMGLSLIWTGAVAGLIGGAVMIWHSFKQRSVNAV
jgi:uncharacterized membrane protein HdeD (DUF308 family)